MTWRGDSGSLWRWAWIAFMVLATSAPYLVNYFCTPQGFHYTWIIPPYPEDSLGYMAWSQQAAHGSFLFKIKYTALPHAPFLFHPFFLLCGCISSLGGWDIGVVHFVAKGIGVVMFFVVFFKYVDYLELNSLQSAIATIMVGVSSGFGWLATKLGFKPDSPYSCPVDLNRPESSTFWSLLWNPLFPYSLALIVLSIYLLDRGTRRAKNRDLWLSGLCVGILSLIHPYQVPWLFVLALLITMVRRGTGAIGCMVRFTAAAFPFVLYTFLVAKLNPIAAMHSSQGRMNSSYPLAYVLGLGLPLFLALAGLAKKWRQLILQYWPLLLWVVLAVSFAYFPSWFQAKFIFGIHVPLCILAGVSADWILSGIPGNIARRWALVGSAVLLLPLAVSTRLSMLVVDRQIVRENADGTYYINADLLNAFNYLKHNSHPDDIVFADLSTSQLIPSFSGNTAVWGHWAMSVDSQQREDWFHNVFGAQSGWDLDKRRREFWDVGIKFVLVGGKLKQWIEDAQPLWLTQGTDKVFENALVTIYRKQDVPLPLAIYQSEGKNSADAAR